MFRIRHFIRCSLMLLCVLCLSTALAQPSTSYGNLCVVSVIQKNSLFNFLVSLVDGLDNAQNSIRRYNDESAGRPKDRTLSSTLSAIKMAKADLECAESQISGYRDSVHAPIRQSAQAIASLFSRLANLQGQTILEFQAAIDSGPKDFNLKIFVARQATRIAAVDAEWQQLVPAVFRAASMASTNLSSTGPAPDLTLMSIQRAHIMKKLKTTFGEDVTKGPARDQKAVITAGAVFYETLNNP